MLTQNIYFVQQICSITYLFLLSFHSLRMVSMQRDVASLQDEIILGFGVWCWYWRKEILI